MKKIGKLNEREQNEAQALAHYIKYINCNPDAKDYEVWDCVQRISKMGEKFLKRNISDEDMKILELDDMKEVVKKFFYRVEKFLIEHENNR